MSMSMGIKEKQKEKKMSKDNESISYFGGKMSKWEDKEGEKRKKNAVNPFSKKGKGVKNYEKVINF